MSPDDDVLPYRAADDTNPVNYQDIAHLHSCVNQKIIFYEGKRNDIAIRVAYVGKANFHLICNNSKYKEKS